MHWRSRRAGVRDWRAPVDLAQFAADVDDARPGSEVARRPCRAAAYPSQRGSFFFTATFFSDT